MTVSVTGNKAVLPAGPYMLFINKETKDGLIPSMSRQVSVGAPLPAYVERVRAASVLGATVVAGSGATLPSTGADTGLALAGLSVLVLAGTAAALRRTIQPR